MYDYTTAIKIDIGLMDDPGDASWSPAEISSSCEAAKDYPRQMKVHQEVIHLTKDNFNIKFFTKFNVFDKLYIVKEQGQT